MTITHTLMFTAFPYICLTTFIVGHIYRYITDRFGWNAHSSEFLEKKYLFYGSILFHTGIIATFMGHAGGLLVPQPLYDMLGITAGMHTAIAHWNGLAVGLAAFVGVLLLVWRRLKQPRIKMVTTPTDKVLLAALAVVIGSGVYNVLFSQFDVLYNVAPWVRGIVTFTPDSTLMIEAPMSLQIHVISAWVLLAFSPFTRLVHIWSAPVFYLLRPFIIYRSRKGKV
mgnify:CR=1 FL=1